MDLLAHVSLRIRSEVIQINRSEKKEEAVSPNGGGFFAFLFITYLPDQKPVQIAAGNPRI